MTWIALDDRRKCLFDPKGLGGRATVTPPILDPRRALPRGTLMIETSLTGEERPERLIGFSATDRPAKRDFELRLVPGGGVTMVHAFGPDVRHIALEPKHGQQIVTLRITYSWDVSTHQARLSIEQPGDIGVATKTLDDPLPMLMSDLYMLFQSDAARSNAMVFAALSTKVEPLGPAPSIAPNAPVATAFGWKGLGDLRRGDTVLGPEGFSEPVLYNIQRDVPAAGSFRPIRLRAPYFGLRGDVVVAPSQQIVISGSHVEYLYGCEAVRVPAAHLVNGTAARLAPTGPIVRYAAALMPHNERLTVAGGCFESLYIGRQRRNADLMRLSQLASAPRINLPEHRAPSEPVLDAFEAITLAELRAA